jgi:hypothetical protein
MRIGVQSVVLLASATVVLAAACGGGAKPVATPSATSAPAATPSATVAPGATPSATPAGDRKVVLAPIDKLDLIIRESFPPQYAVRILSGLPNGCAQFNEARITDRTASTITIEVTNTMPTDPNVACTQIYGTHESIVELGSDFGPGKEYLVRVNDKELRFTAQ